MHFFVAKKRQSRHNEIKRQSNTFHTHALLCTTSFFGIQQLSSLLVFSDEWVSSGTGCPPPVSLSLARTTYKHFNHAKTLANWCGGHIYMLSLCLFLFCISKKKQTCWPIRHCSAGVEFGGVRGGYRSCSGKYGYNVDGKGRRREISRSGQWDELI